MAIVIGVRFSENGRMYYFDPGESELHEGDGVIVETARGMEFADVIQGNQEVPEEQIVAPLKGILRVATDADRETRRKNAERETQAYDICVQKIQQHGLDMKLVNVEYSFNGSKVTFYFTAEGRVDFRELVKDLAFQFKTRIELRQIGVRDEAKMLGGLGSCGRPVCCKTFLDDFQPVSIKMAKEQNLSLSPTKISGLCGRLMCCLKYEQDAYEAMRKLMPKVSKEVVTPDGWGTVLDNNAITEKTKVRVALPDGTYDVREYHFSDVHRPEAGEEAPVIAPAPVREPREPRVPKVPRVVRPHRVERKPFASLAERDADAESKQPTQEPAKSDQNPAAAPAEAGEQPKKRSNHRRGGRNRRRSTNPQGAAPKAPETPQ